jgi:hypothetical protein
MDAVWSLKMDENICVIPFFDIFVSWRQSFGQRRMRFADRIILSAVRGTPVDRSGTKYGICGKRRNEMRKECEIAEAY